MKSHPFLSVVLLTLLLASCAPVATATQAPATQSVLPTEVLPATPVVATEPPASEATALPIATSRGPDLYATDPAAVSLDSGGLQFVEFFRFT